MASAPVYGLGVGGWYPAAGMASSALGPQQPPPGVVAVITIADPVTLIAVASSAFEASAQLMAVSVPVTDRSPLSASAQTGAIAFTTAPACAPGVTLVPPNRLEIVGASVALMPTCARPVPTIGLATKGVGLLAR